MSDKLNIKFLEELTNAFGPSGHETEAQKLAHAYGKKTVESFTSL